MTRKKQLLFINLFIARDEIRPDRWCNNKNPAERMWWNDGETRSAGVHWLHPTVPGCLIISFGCSSRLLFSVLIRWCSVRLRRCASVALHCETVDKWLHICTFHCPFSRFVLHCKTAVWNQTSYAMLLWDLHSLSVFLLQCCWMKSCIFILTRLKEK